MINIVTLKGNLGSAPQFKMTQEGKEMATFSLATSYSWKDSQGEWHTHVDWHRISVFNELTVRWMKGALRKGDVVDVVGRLMYKEWKDKLGQKHISARIVVSQRDGSIKLAILPESKIHEKVSNLQEEENPQTDAEESTQPDEGESL